MKFFLNDFQQLKGADQTTSCVKNKHLTYQL